MYTVSYFNGALPVISSRKYDPVQEYSSLLIYCLEEFPNDEAVKQVNRFVSKNPSSELYTVNPEAYKDVTIPVHPLIHLETDIDVVYSLLEGNARIGFIAGKPTRLERFMLNRVNLLRTQFPDIKWTAISVASHEVGFFNFCDVIVDSLWYNLTPKKQVAMNVNGTVRLQPFHKAKHLLLKYDLPNWHKNNVLKASYLEIAESRNFDMTGYHVNSMGITIDMVNFFRQEISERRT